MEMGVTILLCLLTPPLNCNTKNALLTKIPVLVPLISLSQTNGAFFDQKDHKRLKESRFK